MKINEKKYKELQSIKDTKKAMDFILTNDPLNVLNKKEINNESLENLDKEWRKSCPEEANGLVKQQRKKGNRWNRIIESAKARIRTQGEKLMTQTSFYYRQREDERLRRY